MLTIINFIMSYMNTFAYSLVNSFQLSENVLFDKIMNGQICDIISLKLECSDNTYILLFILFFLLIIISAFYYYFPKKLIPLSAVIVFLCGYVLYFIGFYSEGTAKSFASILRPIMSSLEMFIGHSDLLEVHKDCKEDQTYMTFFSVTHFCAVIISLYVILNWLRRRLYQWWRLEWEICKEDLTENLYVFFDTNDAAWTLARSINKHYEDQKNNDIKDKASKKDVSYKIIFIDEPNEVEDDKEKKSFIDLLSLKFFRKRTLDRIKSKELPNALYIRSEKNISSFMEEFDYFWSVLGLDKLYTIIKKSQKVHLFFFSEDSEDNLRAVQNLRSWSNKNVTSEEKAESNNENSSNKEDNSKLIEVYCKARRNEKNSIYEEFGYMSKDRNKSFLIHIVDDSSIAVLNLKRNSDYHPINYVNETVGSAIIKSKFEALILGFGQTGRDAFRFLYEYATFPGINENKGEDERSPIKIHVYDKNIANLEGAFLSKCPALRQPYNNSRFAFNSIDVKHLEFWDELKSIIRNVSYVVIALGDDDLNIAVAVDLYKFALKLRSDILDSKFDIFVRLYSSEKSQEFDLLTEHLCNNTLDDNIINNQNLISFGTKKDIYTYDIIIKEDAIKKAQIFAYIYDGKYDNKISYVDNCKNAKTAWDNKLKSKNKLVDVWDRIRKNEQDLTNSWHMFTKIIMMQKSDFLTNLLMGNLMIDNNKKECTPSNINKEYHGINTEYNNVDKQSLSKTIMVEPELDSFDTLSLLIKQIIEKQLIYKSNPSIINVNCLSNAIIKEIEYIAKCEHLRWNALSELQGYTRYFIHNDENIKDLISKELSCLRSWNDLQKYKDLNSTRVYDYNIVLGSILMHLIEENEKSKNKQILENPQKQE